MSKVSRRASYELSGTMDRLRSSLMGKDELHEASWLEKVDSDESSSCRSIDTSTAKRHCRAVFGQVPAVVLIGMFHLMIGIPFGVSYFPISWSGDDFPLPGKEALGIRMFLFSTIVGQVVFTFKSGFVNPIGLQMVENVPFCHELATIAIAHQGMTLDALSTVFVMFGLASLVVGSVFYLLGHFRLGRIVYYFPNHVLVGCIGGIGIFIAKTGIEVTINTVFQELLDDNHLQLFGVVLIFEVLLRVLERYTTYALLSPIYFCSITPIFYAALWLLRIPIQSAMDTGYFFPALDECIGPDCGDSVIFNADLFDIWRVIRLPSVSGAAMVEALPTLLALTLFSLIHVPINIPAFAISSNTEVDMNQELVAHGYSNFIAGLLGGLQNYMAYTQSVVYDRAKGRGKASGVAVAILTSLLFCIGPTIASYIPRCMAGTLLLHVGIDLFLEGVYDSIGKFDMLEYAGIWLITVVMTLYGMEAAMMAGFVTAITTYAVQNMAYVEPLRGSMSAATLRSSHWNRCKRSHEILSDAILGRNRIQVIQLQGHLFFGNMAHLTETIAKILQEKQGTPEQPLIVIVDFGLVLGIDSSAAQAIAKMKRAMLKDYEIQLCLFVTGSIDGFPTEFDLTTELSTSSPGKSHMNGDVDMPANERTGLLDAPHDSPHEQVRLDLPAPTELTGLLNPPQGLRQDRYTGSMVCQTLDLALIFAENALLVREDPSLVEEDLENIVVGIDHTASLAQEKEVGLRYLVSLCPQGTEKKFVERLWRDMERELYAKGDVLWRQGSQSDCFKLLVRGTLKASLENEAGTSETIASGNTIGELGLVENIPRFSSVVALSDEAVLYSLSRDAFERLAADSPKAARLVDLICVRYLSARVQHVSNRIFETRCLPV